MKKFCMDELHMRKTDPESLYLGNPLFNIGKSRTKYQFLEQKVDNKLSSWKRKTLSLAGRATYIRSVVQSTLIYAMQSSRLPQSTSDGLDASIRKFWWGVPIEKNRYFTPKCWDSLCRNKKNGGMHFQ